MLNTQALSDKIAKQQADFDASQAAAVKAREIAEQTRVRNLAIAKLLTKHDQARWLTYKFNLHHLLLKLLEHKPLKNVESHLTVNNN